LAYLVGKTGRIVAVDISRWHFFEEITSSAGLRHRIIPSKVDARELPFPFKSFDLAVLVYDVRSLKSEKTMIKVFIEMLRVAERVFIAETLPIAKNQAQEAHLEMYNLREEFFEALFGEKDDLHYLPLERLKELLEKAGGRIIESGVFEPNLPHYLAYIPREYVEQIKNEKKNVLSCWKDGIRRTRNGKREQSIHR